MYGLDVEGGRVEVTELATACASHPNDGIEAKVVEWYKRN